MEMVKHSEPKHDAETREYLSNCTTQIIND